MSKKKEEWSDVHFFKCADLVCIAALAYMGFQIHGFEEETDGSGRLIAYFQVSDELNRTLELFWQKELRVEPMHFWQLAREIKGRIRAHQSIA